MKLRSLLFISALILLASCGPSMRVYTDRDESANFNQYATYNFLEYTDGNVKTITGMELERIRVAFARELEGRGLTFAENNPDVSVQITVYHRQASDGYYGYYGYPSTHHYMERAITVDVYENKMYKHVWHGAGVGQLESNPEKRAEQLPRVAARVFESYPVASAVTD